MNFITVRSTSLLSKYFGQTEASLRQLFRKARAAAPCMLFFDDFDAIAHNRCLACITRMRPWCVNGITDINFDVEGTMTTCSRVDTMTGGGVTGKLESLLVCCPLF